MAFNLESLIKILEQIFHQFHHQPQTSDLNNHHHYFAIDSNKEGQIEFLLDKARSLRDLFENSAPVNSEKVQCLESRVRDATYAAEDAIESYLVSQHLSRLKRDRNMIHPSDLQQVIQEFDLIKEEMMKIMDRTEKTGHVLSSFPVSSTQNLNPMNIVVGLSEDLIQLKERITWQNSTLKIIPIVGMGGIGKTTLARSLFSDPFLFSHFDVRAWATISQTYKVRDILLDILQCINGNPGKDKIQEANDDELALHLYKILYGRRYLIVLDDMWSSEAWDDIKMFFPDEKNGSCVILTTRDNCVADYANSQRLHHQMNFLNETESWKLLCMTVFNQEACPVEFEQVGKTIAKDCNGLPLVIHVVGGILSQMERNKASWLHLGKNVRSAVTNDGGHVWKVLSLSYNLLSNYLKPCFLYMAAFPEDHPIKASRLIMLWVAEGFLKPVLGQSLEETAKVYLKELLNRNLLSVYSQKVGGNVKSYIMHDLLRDFCIRKAEEEKFLHAFIDPLKGLPDNLQHLRRLSTHNYDLFPLRYPAVPTLRSFLMFEWHSLNECIDEMPMLRVMHASLKRFTLDESKLEELVNLRYLAITLWCKLPSWLPNLCNLQTLIVDFQLTLMGTGRTLFIFDLPQLRHVVFRHAPLHNLEYGECVDLLSDLQTLSNVRIDESFPKILEATPNLKKLGIQNISFTDEELSAVDLSSLIKLEVLHWSNMLPRLLIFPPCLIRLSISFGGYITDELMNIIGSLPNLEVLTLHNMEFSRWIWEPNEGQFQLLRSLILTHVQLMTWIANEIHYPRLEHLVIRDCCYFLEIPCDIGEISTLKVIEVCCTSGSPLLNSVQKIQDEQLLQENDSLQFDIATHGLVFEDKV